MMRWISCALDREAMTAPPISSPTLATTPSTLRMAGSASGPSTKSGAASA